MKEKLKLASSHLNSKILFEEFQKLTTRRQYTIGERGEITEQTEIINSEPMEEDNQYRLQLAEKVLVCATQCLELEINIDAHKQHAKVAKEEQKKSVADSPPSGSNTGGYH